MIRLECDRCKKVDTQMTAASLAANVARTPFIIGVGHQDACDDCLKGLLAVIQGYWNG